MNQNLNFPLPGIYLKKILFWNRNGDKEFQLKEISVQIIGQTDKSFKIRYNSTAKESWVRKRKILLNYLKRDFCTLKQRHVPLNSCQICHERCALRGQSYPIK